jgi:hypothetical protein
VVGQDPAITAYLAKHTIRTKGGCSSPWIRY